MKLPEGYRTILAGFSSPEAARRAARALGRMGAEAVQVDRVSRYPGSETEAPRQPLSGRVESLAALTLGLPPGDPDRGAALAADPAASGLAGGPSPGWTPYLLTAVVAEEQAERALEVVRRHGGRL